MRLRRLSLLSAALLAVAAILPAVLLTRASRAGGAAPSGGSVLIVASPAILPVGSRCTVALYPRRTGQAESRVVYEGTIAGVADGGITLRVAMESVVQITSTVGAQIPYLDRLFRVHGIVKPAPGQTKDIWIPAATIRSVRLAGS